MRARRGLLEHLRHAGILFDPHSTEEITRAMADVLLDAELRARMERLGLQRATLFNWQKTAERTLQVYHEVASGAGTPACRVHTHVDTCSGTCDR